VVPLDRHTPYERARGSLALDRSSLLAARTMDGAEIGFHPSMPEIRDLFAMQRLAIVANVGSPEGKPPAPLLDSELIYLPGGFAAPKWAAAFTRSGTIRLDEATTGYAGRSGRSGIVRLAPDRQRVPAPGAGRLSTPFPGTSAGMQLQQVAAALAQSRNESQFFFVPLLGFATRAEQLPRHAAALRDLSQAMEAFFNATRELGISHSVTTYTDGVFNRTMAPTHLRGSAPAWAGHQLVMGGSVLGGQLHGSFPDFTLGGPDDAGDTGIWIPRIMKAQYHATLARWAGMPDGELRRTFGTSPDFPQTDLGFLG